MNIYLFHNRKKIITGLAYIVYVILSILLFGFIVFIVVLNGVDKFKEKCVNYTIINWDILNFQKEKAIKPRTHSSDKFFKYNGK